MAKMTSAYANKVLKKLMEDKDFYLRQEQECQTFIAALDEEPVIPEYDYEETAAIIEEIDQKVLKIKHAINLVNVTNEIIVGEEKMTVDAILVRMSQLNYRKRALDLMRKRMPKERISSGAFGAKKTAPEYQYINYDLDKVKSEYERIDNEIAQMQIALDKFNQIYEFEVEI